jgi:hypothetical protein
MITALSNRLRLEDRRKTPKGQGKNDAARGSRGDAQMRR